VNRTKSRPFLEVLSSTLHEDYRFPLLEVFVLVYAFGTFVLTNISITATSLSNAAFQTVGSALNIPIFVFTILLVKNLAFGLGNDIEKGIIQTYFAYPLKRSRILTAKLLSAIGLSILILMSIQILSLTIIAPGIVISQIGMVLLSYAAYLSYPLIVAGVLLLVALITKKGSIALIVGIMSFFGVYILTNIVSSLFSYWNSILGVISCINPSIALNYFFQIIILDQ
jgi:ABC-type transport system involved in multi-copper enzyme maturation permease subunit